MQESKQKGNIPDYKIKENNATKVSIQNKERVKTVIKGTYIIYGRLKEIYEDKKRKRQR